MKISGIFILFMVAVALLLSLRSGFAYDEVSPADLKDKLSGKSPSFILLDVRNPDEVADCKIPGSVHIPLPELKARVNELDPKKETVVYCLRGGRSAKASALLEGSGFKNVKNLIGGITAWKGANGKIEGPCKQ